MRAPTRAAVLEPASNADSTLSFGSNGGGVVIAIETLTSLPEK